MTRDPRDVLEDLEAAGMTVEASFRVTPPADAEVPDDLFDEAVAIKPELLRLLVLGIDTPPPPEPRPDLPDISSIRIAAGARWWTDESNPTPDGALQLLELIRREWPGEAVRRLRGRYQNNLDAVGPKYAFNRLYGDCVLFTAPPAETPGIPDFLGPS